MNTANIAALLILTLILGAVIVFYKDSIPAKLRRGLAISAAVMLMISFILTVYTLFSMGT
ncbi:hypothetical protein [Saccharibacillus sp. JS10]|uniref:hypothetical protein n=1 Tax=Saccharibacillus sp. JS10 TaxID=2950552 RepID=UPI00210AEAB6|nr:hypothetical protein [Saccharibacillus sp. JS10]MCQ4087006.1 hypothetical protein [Saccharibacillus sp. JS10]